MCLAVIDWKPGQNTPLRVVANRDEFRHRVTKKMHWWDDHSILAGRDLSAGGTWLGFHRDGRFALLTNIRLGFIGNTAPQSRGELIIKYLTEFSSIDPFQDWFKNNSHHYGGCNLILGHKNTLFWCSSNHLDGEYLSPGIYGLSNDALDTDWPKVVLARSQMAQYNTDMLDNLTDHPILSSTGTAPEALLPETGLPIERERMLSAQTITNSEYGTRSRTHFVQDSLGHFNVVEQQLDDNGRIIETNRFTTDDDDC